MSQARNTGYQTYGKICTLAAGGVVSPGSPGTDDAASIGLGFDRFVFASNSEYRVNVNGTNAADLIFATGFTYGRSIDIAPGAKLTVKLWTPDTTLNNVAVDVLRTDAFFDNDSFTTNWQANKNWSNLQVNYDRTGTPRRVYVSGTYTKPPPLGSIILMK